ncbi:Alpha/Beta hydrolase protein [Lentinula aff. lateritia]|uniref:Alpha/Beta hydrolase protein n=1 Tax=Lentinula aff. lateritia TaxID=2804960 RepID=A0ACC1TRK8_9AGAR|nr:Alpha/Beta hydrolase protein [Lentinula aff. lateritia]
MLLWPFSWTKSVPPLPLPDVKHLHEDPQFLSSILLHYTTPGVAPPSARSDPKLKPQERPPVRFWHLWKYGFVAAVKATELTGAVLAHQIWGPKKKSWGIEMTILNSLMRGVNRHSHLVDITTIRLLMGLAGLVPLPSDALVSPVTFNVRKRNLRGILAECDQNETGNRELTGEWVVGRRTWQWKKARISNENHKKRKERVILYIHGGAYYVSCAAAQRTITIPLAKYTDARVFALDYRLAPETRFPGPLHDAASAYMRLVEDLHIPPSSIILAGDSAGGGLTLALLMYLRDNQYELPSAAILMSPWVDLTMSCESWDSNEPYDIIPMPAPDDHLNPVALYLGDNMEQYMTHPYASPLFGDFTGLPPLLIQAGDSEVLRDEITLLAHKASLAGVEVRHELFQDAIHVFQLYPFLDATSRSFSSIRDFVRKLLPQIGSEVPDKLGEQAEKVIGSEIESERAILVGGDGQQTATGVEEMERNIDAEVSTSTDSSSDTDEENRFRKTPNELSSWSRRSWMLSPFSLLSLSVAPVPSKTTRRRADTLPSSAAFSDPRRSAVTPPKKPTQSRTRSQSHIPQLGLNSRRSGLPPRISIANNKMPHPGPSTLPNRSFMHMTPPWSTTDSLPPSPSIRRSSRASSHQDLSSLVQDWASAGPANRTFIYPLSGS